MQARLKRFTRFRNLFMILTVVVLCAASPALYTVSALALVRKTGGVHITPQAGIQYIADHYYCGVEKVVIDHASTNSFDGSDPHVWYVIFRIYAKSHAPCDSSRPGTPLYHGTYERGGHFYLNLPDGWVMVPEGLFPQFIGDWMKILHLAGPGDSTHIPKN